MGKARAILAPSDGDGLEAVFYSFCGIGKSDMDGKSFLKMCKDCKLMEGKVTETVIDLLFKNTAVKEKGTNSIGFDRFLVALEMLCEKTGANLEKVRNTLLEATRPIHVGTKADFVRFH